MLQGLLLRRVGHLGDPRLLYSPHMRVGMNQAEGLLNIHGVPWLSPSSPACILGQNGKCRGKCSGTSSDCGATQEQKPSPPCPQSHLLPLAPLFLPLGLLIPFLSTLLTFSNKKFPTLPALLWAPGVLPASITPLPFQSDMCTHPSEHCVQGHTAVQLASLVVEMCELHEAPMTSSSTQPSDHTICSLVYSSIQFTDTSRALAL